MRGGTALLTFSIGPVQSFISQARRMGDLWAGSYLLSHLVRQAVGVVYRDPACEMVFPYLPDAPGIPDALPNRFVCRVPAERAEAIALEMKKRIESVWSVLVRYTMRVLGPRLAPETALGQTERLFDFSWSWVPEGEGGYAAASLEGALQFAQSRQFRPFLPAEERGEKCAICGERTALPDGDRGRVRAEWDQAQKDAENLQERHQLKKFLHLEQTRLCLVCATKRFFTHSGHERRMARFLAFDEFQSSEQAPYFALVKMDGDRMGAILGLPPERLKDGNLESFHREVSSALSRFAEGLHSPASADLNLDELSGFEPAATDRLPQLLYAGGDDVLLVCGARDALPLVEALRKRYLAAFEKASAMLEPGGPAFTISAAVLFAHPGHPAGLLLRELEELLDEGAKDRGGRNAVAIRLAKRGGPPVEVVFGWGERDWIAALQDLVGNVRESEVSSSQTFNLRLEEKTLKEIFQREDPAEETALWETWLAERLSRSMATAAASQALAQKVAPFFVHGRSNALRIARFLGREAERGVAR